MIPLDVWCLVGRMWTSVWLEERVRDEIDGIFVPLTVGPNYHSLKNCGAHC
uniref:Uncharacterized protein n=1 Tax=Setaria italica TaxID=4555 RepID=K4A3P9_SETIT